MDKKEQYENIPPTWKPMGYDFLYALFLFSLFQFHNYVFHIEETYKEDFPQRGFFYILGYVFFSVLFIMNRYFFSWKYSMLAVHASGISYQKGKDGREDFKAIQVCRPEKLVFSKHPKVKVDHWNMGTQEWLRKSIYERSPFENRAASQLLTFMTSAFWHGFYPGYYLSFFMWFCLLHIGAKVYRENKKPDSFCHRAYKKLGRVGKFINWFLATFFLMVNGLYFWSPDFSTCLTILAAVYYVPLLPALIVLILTFYGPPEPIKKKRKVKIDQDDGEDGNLSSTTEDSINSSSESSVKND